MPQTGGEHMSILTAIKERKSIRTYKPDPVPKAVLAQLMNAALRAPSWSNTQTWEVAVLGGPVFEQIKATLSRKLLAEEKGNPDVSFPRWERKYLDRRDENGTRLYGLLGIGLDEKDKQRQWYAKMARYYDAPNGIIVYTDRGIDSWAMLNIGLLLENIALAALEFGLGTCMIAAGVNHAGTIRNILAIPDSKQLVIALSIGYPEPDAVANRFRSNRLPLDSMVSWHGF